MWNQDHHAEKTSDKFYADVTWQQQGWAEGTVEIFILVV